MEFVETKKAHENLLPKWNYHLIYLVLMFNKDKLFFKDQKIDFANSSKHLKN